MLFEIKNIGSKIRFDKKTKGGFDSWQMELYLLI